MSYYREIVTALHAVNKGALEEVVENLVRLATKPGASKLDQDKYEYEELSIYNILLTLAPDLSVIYSEIDKLPSIGNIIQNLGYRKTDKKTLRGVKSWLPPMLGWYYYRSREKAKEWHLKYESSHKKKKFLAPTPTHDFKSTQEAKRYALQQINGELQSSIIDEVKNQLGLEIPEREEHKIWTSVEMKFSQENTSFVGRKAEFKELNEFLDDERAFLWWQISGDAGAGKSRLALKVVKERSKYGWEAGFLPFLDDASIQKFSKANIDTPTLIVIDASEVSLSAGNLQAFFSTYGTIRPLLKKLEF